MAPELNMHISDGKTHKHIANTDSVKESENNCRKISPEASEDNIKQLSCKSGANESDAIKDVMDASFFKREKLASAAKVGSKYKIYMSAQNVKSAPKY